MGTSSVIMCNIINAKSIKFFEKSKFYKEAMDALQYIAKEEKSIRGWLNFVVIKEFLTIRAEIDLNYIDLHASNLGLFGWKLEEPLIVILDVSEVKLLNIPENELAEAGFSDMWNRGMITFQVRILISNDKLQCVNAGSSNSYGCKDYIRKVFETFIKAQVYSNSGTQFLEESKKGGFGALGNNDKKSKKEGP